MTTNDPPAAFAHGDGIAPAESRFCFRNSDGVMPVISRKVLAKALWSVKPHSKAIAATESSPSRRKRVAAAMRVLEMSCIGLMPKMRLMMRAKRDAGRLATRASSEGEMGSW